MRIAHLCTKFSRLSETFIYDLVLGLERDGVENHVLTAARENVAARPFARVRVLRAAPWRLAAFAFRRRRQGAYRFPLPRRATHRALWDIRPAAILAHFGGAGLAIAPAARELGIPLVVVFHAFDLFTRPFRAATYAPLWESGAHAVAISDHGRRRLLELGCPAGRIRVIRCGTDLSRFPAAPARRPDTAAFRLVTIGRLVEKKGYDVLIRAVSALRRDRTPGARLDLWGTGPLAKHLARLIRELGLNGIVTLRGPADHRAVPAILLDHDAFVLSSRTARDGDTEGIPITLLEAQSAGLPVVATLHAGIPEAVPPENHDLLARENDIEELARKLADLAGRRDQWSAIGRRGRDWVAARFSLRDEVAAYRRLFEEVTAPCR